MGAGIAINYNVPLCLISNRLQSSHVMLNPQWSWSSMASVAPHDLVRGNTRICSYKGQLVAVKEIKKTYVDIKNEQIRRELRIVSLSKICNKKHLHNTYITLNIIDSP